jgi:hypothetical protein
MTYFVGFSYFLSRQSYSEANWRKKSEFCQQEAQLRVHECGIFVVHFVRAKNDEVGYRATNSPFTVQSMAGFSDSCARKTYSETNNWKQFRFYKEEAQLLVHESGTFRSTALA